MNSSMAGQSRTASEVLSPEPAEALANLLMTDVPHEFLPPLWHGVYLLERSRQADLGTDGHQSNGFPIPPRSAVRRMFAGGRVRTFRPLQLRTMTTKRTEVIAEQKKRGRSGGLTFITVRNEYSQDGDCALIQEDDIVYFDSLVKQSSPAIDLMSPERQPDSDCRLTLTADEALLFRYSALTYNAHRIHYDRDFAASEGYTGLVVHGPLQVLMMAEVARSARIDLTGQEFSYRLVCPMVGTQTFAADLVGGSETPAFQVRDGRGVVTAVGAVSQADESVSLLDPSNSSKPSVTEGPE